MEPAQKTSEMPLTPPSQGCYMRQTSPGWYGQCGFRHSHPSQYHMPYPRHMPILPIYYPPRPPGRFPRHMMTSPPQHRPHRHPHMGCVRSPVLPPYPSCYPYHYSPGPAAHSWNQHKFAMQKCIPQRYTPVISSHGQNVGISPQNEIPDHAESTKTSESSSKKGNKRKGKRRREADKNEFTSAYSDSEEIFEPSSNRKRNRSKYKTLLGKLAVNENPVTIFNTTTKPYDLSQAVCMYIDYLIASNESKIGAAECNAALITDPGLHYIYDECYHEVLSDDTAFPSEKFENWLAGYDLCIDRPDGTDPGEKGLPDPKTVSEQDQASIQPYVQNSVETRKKPHGETSPKLGQSGKQSGAEQDTNVQGEDSTTDTSGIFVPVPSAAASRVSESIDDGCVVTLVEDETPTEGATDGKVGHIKIGDDVYPAVVLADGMNEKSAKASAKKRSTKQKLCHSPGSKAETYLPPIKPCTDREEKTNNSETIPSEDPTSKPTRESRNHCPSTMMDQLIPYVPDANMDSCPAYLNAATNIPNHATGPGIVASSPIASDKVEEKANKDSRNDVVCLQPSQPILESQFYPYTADLQRVLNTPKFDEVTPFKEYAAPFHEPHGEHIQMSDPVLIETVGKRMKTLPHDQLTSEESSRDSMASNDLDGIEVLKSPVGVGWARSTLTQALSAAVSQPNLVTDHLQPSAATKYTENFNTCSRQSTLPLDACDAEFQCPFTGENLTKQVQLAMAHSEAQDQFSPTKSGMNQIPNSLLELNE